jgi:hypothetical protein
VIRLTFSMNLNTFRLLSQAYDNVMRFSSSELSGSNAGVPFHMAATPSPIIE